MIYQTKKCYNINIENYYKNYVGGNMAGLKYCYLFLDTSFDEAIVTIELYRKCGSMSDIFMCETSIRELEESINGQLKREKLDFRLKKDKIHKILNDMESKEYITFVKRGKGRQKSIIRINIKDIINGKYKFKSTNKS